MPSPFPGMDLYIESQCGWPGFHLQILANVREALNPTLPDDYVVEVEERVVLLEEPGERVRDFVPDVLVASQADRPADCATAVLEVTSAETATVTLAERDPEEVRERWLEIRRLPDLTLVTVIEVLSPHNKIDSGRDEYLAKRSALLKQPVHIVEIDLLVSGRRPPIEERLPRADYIALVARAGEHPKAKLHAWSVRQPLPTIPIPLKAPDPDIALALGPAVARAYDLGRYHRTIKYTEPLELPLSHDDRLWAQRVGQAAASTP